MCGEVNRCAHGLDAVCNCDGSSGNGDSTFRSDWGWLINKTVLPVTKVCMGYSRSGGNKRSGRFDVYDFKCRPGQTGNTLTHQAPFLSDFTF